MATTVTVSSASELLSAIANRSTDTVIVLKAGDYGSVSINGNGSSLPITLQAEDPSHSPVFQFLTINNASNVSLNGLTFTPPASGGVFTGASLTITNSQNVTVDASNFVGGPTGFTDSAYGISASGSSNITVSDSTFTGLRKGGIFQNDQGVTLTGNTLTNLREDGFDLIAVQNVDIGYNKFSDFHPAGADHPDAIQFMTLGTTTASANINIHDNYILFTTSAPGQGIFMGNEAGIAYQNVVIKNNIVYTGVPQGISIATASGVQISNNIAVATDAQTAYKVQINVSNASNVVVSSNIADAIGVSGVSGGSVTSNTTNYLALSSNSGVSSANNTEVGGLLTKATVEAGGVGSGGTTPTVGQPVISAFSTDSGTVGDRITNDNTLTLTGTAVANSTVKVYDGATLLGSTTANSSGAWSYDTGTLADGSHSLSATATDSTGATSTASIALAVTVDTAAPNAPTIASFSTDSGTVGDRITNDTTLTLSGTAAANSTIKVYDGATLLGSATANSSGAWSYTTGTLADGSHSFTATATDAAGNTGVASGAFAVTMDTAAPAKPSIASFSTDSGTVGDGITNDKTLMLTGTAEANSTVKVYDGATLLGSATANSSGAWSYTTGNLTDGAHRFTATATDVAGNTGAASTALAVTVDTASATPAIKGVLPGTGSALTLTGTAEATSTVKVYDGATLLGTVNADAAGSWSLGTSSLVSGAHSLTATATDVAGNTSAASSVLTLKIGGAGSDTIAGGAGTNTLIGLGGNDTVTGNGNDDTAAYSGNRSDYLITYSPTTQTFTVVDQRAGSPDGTDSVNGVDHFQFASGTVDANELTAQTVTTASGGTVLTFYDVQNQYDWSIYQASYDAAGRHLTDDAYYNNGSHAYRVWDPSNQRNWTYSANYYDPNGAKTEENLDWDSGFHSRWNFDTQNQTGWSSIYSYYDSNWNKLYEETIWDNGTSTSWGSTSSSAPVILDLDGDGVEIATLGQSRAIYDMNGDGQRSATAWVGGDDGLLVIDLGADGTHGPDGVIDQARELVFTQWLPGSTSDMAALRAVFDTNGDGRLDASDARWDEFRVWKDANGDGISQAGELVGLDTLGIKSIDLNPTGTGQNFSDGSAIRGVTSFTRTDGTSGTAGDVSLAGIAAGGASASNAQAAIAGADPAHGILNSLVGQELVYSASTPVLTSTPDLSQTQNRQTQLFGVG